TFITVQGEPRQQVHDPADFGFRVQYQDLRGQADAEPVCQATIQEDLTTAFDLRNGPLFKAKLLQLEEHRYTFILTLHHIVCDAWSMVVMLNEVLLLYRKYEKGEENPLPPLRIHYKDYAGWQNKLIQENSLHEHRNYWLNQFKGELPVLNLPIDFPRPPVKTYTCHSYTFALDTGVSAGLRELAQKYEVSLFSIVLASINVFLHKYTGADDIIIGSPSAARGHKDIEDQIGFYLNALAFRTRLDQADSFLDVLHKVKENVMKGIRYENYPFDLILDDLKIKRDFSRASFFDVGFTWLNRLGSKFLGAREDNGEEQLSFEIERVEGDFLSGKADLWFNGWENADEICLTLQFNTDLFKESTNYIMIEKFKTLMAEIVKDIHCPIPLLELELKEEKTLSTQAINIEFNF
ncbi:MAG: hypothetical protein ICV83_12775, partial [Cytophagales bacterium]|nr:hypothetical protein [Cytophagales bacterium]